MTTVRTTSLMALALLSSYGPVSAQETFQAWGHEFFVPGQTIQAAPLPGPRRFDALSTYSAAATHRSPNGRRAGHELRDGARGE
jgi:hypothetical protein